MSIIKPFTRGSALLITLYKSLNEKNVAKISKQLAIMPSSSYSSYTTHHNILPRSDLNLTPRNFLLIPACGLKIKGQLELRCKDCYFERKDGVLYVSCKSYPRHKQRAMTQREKYTWILSHCTQSKRRPY